MDRWNYYLSLVLMTLIVVSGCGRDARLPNLVPVEGRVTLDGQPLANATITFIPSGNTVGRGAGAMTDDSGTYRLKEQDGSQGTAVGSYRVVISKLVNSDGSDFVGDRLGPMDTNARELLPARYSDFGRTESTAEVVDGGGTIDLKLSSS